MRSLARASVTCVLVVLCRVECAPCAEIAFNQISWRDNAGGYNAQNSEWGQADLQFGASDAPLFFPNPAGGLYGYLNLVTSVPGGHADNWAVQNMPLVFNNADELAWEVNNGFHFDLGTPRGAQVAGLDYRYEITPEPLFAAPLGAMSPASVAGENRLEGGLISTVGPDPFSGGTGNGPPIDAHNFLGVDALLARGPGAPPRAVSAKVCNERINVPPVGERPDHCSPGAVTRGLRYLQRTHSDIVLTGSTQTIFDEVASKMETSEGGGTTIAPTNKVLDGKRAYTDMYTLSITTTLTEDPCVALMAIQNKHAVEINVSWGKNRDGTSRGAHTAFVAEIQKDTTLDGRLLRYWVRVIDDPDQTDGLVQNRSYWLRFNPTGTLFGHGSEAHLWNFMIETPAPGSPILLALGCVFAARRRRKA